MKVTYDGVDIPQPVKVKIDPNQHSLINGTRRSQVIYADDFECGPADHNYIQAKSRFKLAIFCTKCGVKK